MHYYTLISGATCVGTWYQVPPSLWQALHWLLGGIPLTPVATQYVVDYNMIFMYMDDDTNSIATRLLYIPVSMIQQTTGVFLHTHHPLYRAT